MAATITANVRDRIEGNCKVTVTTVTAVDNYATGGISVSAAQLGLNTVLYTICNIVVPDTQSTAVAAVYTPSTGKLVLNTAAAQIANDLAIDTLQVQIVAFGQ